MRELVMALAFALLGVHANKYIGDCVDGKCFVVQTDTANFDAAQKVCEERTGHLMTIRTAKLADVLSRLLLKGESGNFWIGLRYVGNECSDRLKGYKWITGDDTSHFSNWKRESDCAPSCVSVSQNDHKWTERPCSDRIDGYVCEYNNLNHCPPLSTDEKVHYSTAFGFTSNELLREIPELTNATRLDLRTKHICFDSEWLHAPWNCEVFDGGCDYTCVRNGQSYACICQPGFKLDTNGISCSQQQDDDPCAHAGCEHECARDSGAFACTCRPGFTLSADGKSCKENCKPGYINENGGCVDVDECATGPCEHDCANTEGSYQCVCFDGYKPAAKDMHKCKMHCPDMRCKAECDPNNDYQCDCPDGFLFDEDDRYCVDVDECISTNDCDQNCTNTPGSFECFCHEGYVLLDNGVCEDLEGSGSSTPFDLFIPTSRPPTDRPLSISAGSLLGVMVCVVVCVLLLVCLAHCILRRLSKTNHYDTHKVHDEIYDFQQVITENDSTQQSLPNTNRYLKRDI
ncbi:thrombomodulin [Danio rerio]|uniref:Thrombomodulin n=1 Tax=Danio rerio TaxID=7955 RepID=A0AC58I6N5_DANRE|nr:thrombomodulin-like [Danio rerio]|eukprot:XP_017208183.1 thrombomodulin-like [Danio rerio]